MGMIASTGHMDTALNLVFQPMELYVSHSVSPPEIRTKEGIASSRPYFVVFIALLLVRRARSPPGRRARGRSRRRLSVLSRHVGCSGLGQPRYDLCESWRRGSAPRPTPSDGRHRGDC